MSMVQNHLEIWLCEIQCRKRYWVTLTADVTKKEQRLKRPDKSPQRSMLLLMRFRGLGIQSLVSACAYPHCAPPSPASPS